MNISGHKQPWGTPCIGVCSTTIGDLVCRGCGRTVEEIRDWVSLERLERVSVNEKAKKRVGHERNL